MSHRVTCRCPFVTLGMTSTAISCSFPNNAKSGKKETYNEEGELFLLKFWTAVETVLPTTVMQSCGRKTDFTDMDLEGLMPIVILDNKNMTIQISSKRFL